VTRDFDDLSNDPTLEAPASALREEWRLEEEEYTRAAEQHWAHSRTLRDVARELMHRGDRVALELAGTVYRGTVVAVGDDYLELATAAGSIDVRIAATPLVVRVIERVDAGGCRAEPGSPTFRARLLEHEMIGGDLVVGTTSGSGSLQGSIVVGRDQVRVRSDQSDAYLAIEGIAWTRRPQE
jgi:hypothetical protein